jgi:hypothetical protein
MTVKPCFDSATPVLHSQLVLPMQSIPAFVTEEYESLWSRVNRICDRYLPTLEPSLVRLDAPCCFQS